MFEGDSTRVEVSKRKESIIKMLKERFQEERCEGDWRIPIKEALMKEEDTAELYPGNGRTVPQDARWGLVQVCGARGSSKKIEKST